MDLPAEANLIDVRVRRSSTSDSLVIVDLNGFELGELLTVNGRLLVRDNTRGFSLGAFADTASEALAAAGYAEAPEPVNAPERTQRARADEPGSLA